MTVLAALVDGIAVGVVAWLPAGLIVADLRVRSIREEHGSRS